MTLLKSLSKGCENNDNIIDITDIVLEHLKALKGELESKQVKCSDYECASPVDQLIMSLGEIREIMVRLDPSQETDDHEKWMLIGRGWLYLGQAQLVIFSSLDSVDPVQKKSLKSEYARDEVCYLKLVYYIIFEFVHLAIAYSFNFIVQFESYFLFLL